jgi:membrane protein
MKFFTQLNYPKNKALFALFKFFIVFVFVGLCANVLFSLYKEQHIQMFSFFSMLLNYIHVDYNHLYSNLIIFFYSTILIICSQYLWISSKQKTNVFYKSLIASYNKILFVWVFSILFSYIDTYFINYGIGVGLSGFTTTLLSYSWLFFISMCLTLIMNIRNKVVTQKQLAVIILSVLIIYLLRHYIFYHFFGELYIYINLLLSGKMYPNMFDLVMYLVKYENETYVCRELYNTKFCLFPTVINHISHIIGTIFGIVLSVINLIIYFKSENYPKLISYGKIKNAIKNTNDIIFIQFIWIYLCLIIYLIYINSH